MPHALEMPRERAFRAGDSFLLVSIKIPNLRRFLAELRIQGNQQNDKNAWHSG